MFVRVFRNTMLAASLAVGAPAEDHKPPVFEAGISLVNLTVAVTDSKGRYVDGLAREQFAVFENGDPQTVAVFEKQEWPIRLILMVDASSSMRGLAKPAKQAAIKLIQTLRPQDQASVALFGDRIRTVLNFTADHTALEQTIAGLAFEDDKTKLYDNLYVVLSDLEREGAGEEYRRVVVVLTDAIDTGSMMSDDQLYREVKKFRTVVYPIIIPPGMILDYERDYRVEYFGTEIAKSTGGRAHTVTNPYTLQAAYDLIAQELRMQYRIGYAPAHARKLRDPLRTIEVRVASPGASVRHRQSYFSQQP
jgi:Ca-activated chloride channel family protein